MVEDMQLRGLSEKTQDAYVRAVRQLAGHYGKSPDCISEEELHQYFLIPRLDNGKQVSPTSTFRIALCGIKFFYQQTLRQAWPILDLVRPRRESCRWCSARPKCAASWGTSTAQSRGALPFLRPGHAARVNHPSNGLGVTRRAITWKTPSSKS